MRPTVIRMRLPLASLPSVARPGLLLPALVLAPALSAQGFEDHKLVPSDGLAGDAFGASVATDGVLVAVGAPRADDRGPDSGSAYVFDAGSGAQGLEFVPLDGAAGDRFGASIAVDGSRVVVGAPQHDEVGVGSGTAYVFDTTTGLQVLELQPTGAAAGDGFGTSVAIDGGLVVVGALDGAFLFDAATGQQLVELVPDGGLPVGGTGVAVIAGGFGQAVDLDADSARIAVGAKTANGASLYAGAAYVFDTAGDELQRVSIGAPWNQFGGSVGIDGDRLVVGAKYASPNGKDSGQAYLFDALSGSLTQSLVPSDGHIFAHFGSAVAADGPHVVVAAEQDNGAGFAAGAVYLYDAQGSFVTKLFTSDAASNDELGEVVAVADGVVTAGASRDDDLGSGSGAAYVFGAAGTVSPMTGCLGNAGTLDHVGGLALAGQTLSFRMDDAQPGATQAVLAISGAPAPGWPGCGVDLGSWGEALIDASLLLFTTTAPWTGSPVDLAVPVPPLAGLAGAPLYLQGALLAPASALEPVRLTDGLQVVLGGYL